MTRLMAQRVGGLRFGRGYWTGTSTPRIGTPQTRPRTKVNRALSEGRRRLRAVMIVDTPDGCPPGTGEP